MAAAPFSLTALVPASGFALTSGRIKRGGIRGVARHQFCAWCLSWVFTPSPSDPSLVNVRPMLLEDPSWFEPFIEVFTREKVSWAATPAHFSYADFPDLNELGTLKACFAAQLLL